MWEVGRVGEWEGEAGKVREWVGIKGLQALAEA